MVQQNSKVEVTDKYDLQIVRTFDAPRDLMWQVWTRQEHLAQWWGPTMFTNPRCEVDAREGGSIYIDMKSPDGEVFPMGGTFEVVEPEEKLVMVSAALDNQGEPMFSVRLTVLFTEQGGKTTVNLAAKVIGMTEIAPQVLEGQSAGWNQSLDKLSGYLSDVQKGRAR